MHVTRPNQAIGRGRLYPIVVAFSRAMPNWIGFPNRPPVGATSVQSEATEGLRASLGLCNSLIQKERLVSSVQSIIGATEIFLTTETLEFPAFSSFLACFSGSGISAGFLRIFANLSLAEATVRLRE